MSEDLSALKRAVYDAFDAMLESGPMEKRKLVEIYWAACEAYLNAKAAAGTESRRGHDREGPDGLAHARAQ
jgi:methionyl-tRNA synthetase